MYAVLRKVQIDGLQLLWRQLAQRQFSNEQNASTA